MKKIRFKKIEILSKMQDDPVFSWTDQRDITVFHFSNGAGKSTVFNLISDILSFDEKRSTELLTEPLLLAELSTELEFEILGEGIKILCKKEYIQGKQTVIVSGGEMDGTVIEKKEEYEQLIIQLLNIPEEIKYSRINKISLGSLLRLNFIDDNSYQRTSSSASSQCNLINHQFDGITTPLFYYYLFKQHKNESDLRSLYKLGKEVKSHKDSVKELEDVLRLHGLVQKGKPKVDDNQISLFDATLVIEDLYKLESTIRTLRYKKYELIDAIEYLRKLHDSLLGEEGKKEWVGILYSEIQILSKALDNAREEIRKSEKKRNQVAEQLSSIENFELNEISKIYSKNDLLKNSVSLSDIKSLKRTTKKEKEILKDLETEFDSNIQDLENNDSFKSFKNRLTIALEKITGNLEVDFLPKKGKLNINSLSDSDNRIGRFVSLFHLLLTPNTNHIGFLFVDSPFIGVNSSRREEVLKILLEDYQSGSTQIFLFTNKDKGDDLENTLINNIDVEYRSGEIGEKIICIDQTILELGI